MPQKRMLDAIRRACLALPETRESSSSGNATFQAGRRTFAVFEIYEDRPSLAVKVAPDEQHTYLEDTAFYMTPYVGQHGWVSLKLDERFDPREIEILIGESYRLVANQRMLRALNGKKPQ
ncbi:MAG: MmcQ/YjbR family DNA-binding protein [Thermoanaerobaculia bacterium]